ncbi:MAG: histidine kinase [Tannerellaceae bacterium]|jgi:signal transduction histidine kinase|nr:histidine kinase [Tannerellaceae bacterium]
MEKNKKTIVLFAAALLFSFGFVIILRLSQNLAIFDMTTVVFGVTNLLSVLSISYLFNKILNSNATKSMVELKKGLIPSFVFSLLATIFIALSLYIFGRYTIFWMKGWSVINRTNVIESGAIISLSIGLFICCMVFFYTTWRQAIGREQKLREENLKYQYRTLKAQVNPHFLFNSLNTLSEIVYEDAKKADHYIQKLSGIYRYILDNEDVDLIPLTKELAFITTYFELQKERAGNKIGLQIQVSDSEKFSIVPVSLQILVENALKHNSISEKIPLKIDIYKEDTLIVVSNNIQRKNNMDNSYGSGLANLKERVKLITGREMAVNQKDNEFIVKIPIISI